MGMLQEFKTFIARGNVLDLAVGVIIGAAFGKIVSSLTDDVIMPVISLVTGRPEQHNRLVNAAGTVPEGAPLARLKFYFLSLLTALTFEHYPGQTAR